MEEAQAHQVEEVMRWRAARWRRMGAARPSPPLCDSKQRVSRGVGEGPVQGSRPSRGSAADEEVI